MGRSSAQGRRTGARRPTSPLHSAPPAEPGALAGASLAAATLPRVGQGLAYRPLDLADRARRLFDYAALAWPARAEGLLAWGAFQPTDGGEQLVGAVVAERSGRCALLHGPVVIAEREPLDIAAQLVSAMLDHAVAAGAATLFARPQGLDRIWVRFGFIPVPEGVLPDGLSGGSADGMYAWRGGSAVWSLRHVDTA